MENYRPGVKHRLGIDYETLRQDNPGLIYASISGFGQDGPLADRPGFDQISAGHGRTDVHHRRARAGALCASGYRLPICVQVCWQAKASCLALLKRERTGEGQWVQSSLLQAQAFMLDFQAARWLMDGEVPGQAGNDHPTSIPTGVCSKRPMGTSTLQLQAAPCGSGCATIWSDQTAPCQMSLTSAEARSDNRQEN